MKALKPVLRSMLIPALLFLGACCCDKEVVAPAPPPPPPPPAPVAAPVSALPYSSINFAYDRSDLNQGDKEKLKKDAGWMAAHPNSAIRAEGYCDERGTEEYNMALGERRAQSAKDYLVSVGADGSRIKTVSFGKERPLDPAHDEAAWAKNRRVEFVVE